MAPVPRILVVDDERSVRKLLRLYLEREGYTVVEADNGLDALSLLRRGGLDVALVDVMLPGIDGFELVRRLRPESMVPVILLTAKGEETSRVVGLELGADDYVVKPFSAPEVVARVRVQLRKMDAVERGQVFQHGSIELDEESRRVSLDGRELELTKREFDLLAALVREPERVHTREGLLELVWGSPYLSSKNVDVTVASLRRKLGGALRLSAIRGVGYRLDDG